MFKKSMVIFILSALLLAACVETPQTGSIPPQVDEKSEIPIEAAKNFLADQLSLPPEQVKIITAEVVNWSDSCLGAAQNGEMCAQVITPGYRVSLDTPQGEYEIHVDESGMSVRVASAEATPVSINPALVWERTGGFANVCLTLTIQFDASYRIEECRISQLLSEGMLTTDQWAPIQKALSQYGVYTWESTQTETGKDNFQDRYTLYGQGKMNPPDVIQESINKYLADLVTELLTTSVDESTSGDSGIRGQIFIGPTCPGPVPSDTSTTSCQDRPFQATISILTPSRVLVASTTSDINGYFEVYLNPGEYILSPQSAGRFPYASEQVVYVTKGEFTKVVIVYDSGIR